jgi:hypothetical protein
MFGQFGIGIQDTVEGKLAVDKAVTSFQAD